MKNALFYAQKAMEIDFLYQAVDVIQELDSKKRKIQSFRGFLLYALEIMEKIAKFSPQIFNPFFGEKSKILFAKIKKELFRNFNLDYS